MAKVKTMATPSGGRELREGAGFIGIAARAIQPHGLCLSERASGLGL